MTDRPIPLPRNILQQIQTKFDTNDELRNAIMLRFRDKRLSLQRYGDIETWDITSIKSNTAEKFFYKYAEKLEQKLSDDETYHGNILSILSDYINDKKLKKYTEWIITSYIGGGIARFEDINSSVKDTLEEYNILFDKKILDKGEDGNINETNIGNFCGLIGCESTHRKKKIDKPGLHDLLIKYDSELKKYREQVKKPKTSAIFYEGEKVKIYQLRDATDAKYYGQASRWCTAAKNNNMFENYNKTDILYAIIPKKERHRTEKYQLGIKRDRKNIFNLEHFMDERDQRPNVGEIIDIYPEILKIPYCLESITLDEMVDSSHIKSLENIQDIFIDRLGMEYKKLIENIYRKNYQSILIKFPEQNVNIEGYTNLEGYFKYFSGEEVKMEQKNINSLREGFNYALKNTDFFNVYGDNLLRKVLREYPELKNLDNNLYFINKQYTLYDITKLDPNVYDTRSSLEILDISNIENFVYPTAELNFSNLEGHGIDLLFPYINKIMAYKYLSVIYVFRRFLINYPGVRSLSNVEQYMKKFSELKNNVGIPVSHSVISTRRNFGMEEEDSRLEDYEDSDSLEGYEDSDSLEDSDPEDPDMELFLGDGLRSNREKIDENILLTDGIYYLFSKFDRFIIFKFNEFNIENLISPQGFVYVNMHSLDTDSMNIKVVVDDVKELKSRKLLDDQAIELLLNYIPDLVDNYGEFLVENSEHVLGHYSRFGFTILPSKNFGNATKKEYMKKTGKDEIDFYILHKHITDPEDIDVDSGNADAMSRRELIEHANSL